MDWSRTLLPQKEVDQRLADTGMSVVLLIHNQTGHTVACAVREGTGDVQATVLYDHDRCEYWLLSDLLYLWAFLSSSLRLFVDIGLSITVLCGVFVDGLCNACDKRDHDRCESWFLSDLLYVWAFLSSSLRLFVDIGMSITVLCGVLLMVFTMYATRVTTTTVSAGLFVTWSTCGRSFRHPFVCSLI